MNLKGLKMNVLGDSITEGHGTSDVQHRFTTLLEQDLELAVCRNYGIGGTRIARQQTPSAEEHWDYDFCTRVEAMDPDADVILVFGGTNDFGHGDAPIGTMEDRTPNTFYGALHTLYTALLNKYPAATIVVATPLHRGNEDNPHGDGFKGDGYGPLSLYVSIIREVAAWYSLPVLDLWSVSGMQPRVPVIQEKYIPDALHPNDAGHRVLADRMEGFLRSL